MELKYAKRHPAGGRASVSAWPTTAPVRVTARHAAMVGRVDQAGLAHGVGEAGGELGDQRLVARPEPPGAVALGHGVAGAGEGLAQGVRRIRTRRGAEALVAPLMGVEGLGQGRVGLVLGRPALVAVVGEHGVERRLAGGDGGREARR